MTKELFVSSTPHESKVGMVEDDQLAEVYMERENEYTLAGSIYKGRVTRVLPGMQSAFVDIGLERDAFLYVSDFMELESQDEDIEEIPTTPMLVNSNFTDRPVPSEGSTLDNGGPEVQTAPEEENSQPAADSSASEQREERGGWRNRRRRRGRRDRGNDASEARYARPAEVSAAPPREEFGPPPGYEPIILPGESISKYRNRGQSASV